MHQLLNSLDPSPLLERYLDRDAEEFIVGTAREAHGSTAAFELVVHLATPPETQHAAETEDAVLHYFAVQAELKQREFRLLLRRGHTALGAGSRFSPPACRARSWSHGARPARG